MVLTSKFSASASEIFAGAIQDYGRGLIVGDHSTHGKGTVQSLRTSASGCSACPTAPQMGALKITMQQFYRPSGDSTQKRGVLADVELPSLTTHLDVGESDLDYPLAFRPRRRRSPSSPSATSTQRSSISFAVSPQQRCTASEKFQKVVRNIARYKEQKAKKSVTLNEAKFLKELRRTRTPTRKKKRRWRSSATPPAPAIKRDFYLDEVLAITTDYISLLKQVAKAN